MSGQNHSKPRQLHVVLVDNHDSFVYNLVDTFIIAGHRCTIYRNTVPIEVILAAQPDLVCLSPGPGYPADSGILPELINQTIGKVPLLGICLGFQGLIEHFGGEVEPCGPVHGTTDYLRLTDAGVAHPVFTGLAVDMEPDHPDVPGRLVPVGRYHSLGCTQSPAGMTSLATCDSEIGPVIMAASTLDGSAIGLQFHPESLLSPSGPIILQRCLAALTARPIETES